MNMVLARCGHYVPAAGAPGSLARQAMESRTCDDPHCKSGLPAKFTVEECEAYCRLKDRCIWFTVDIADKSVVIHSPTGDYRYPSLIVADKATQTLPWDLPSTRDAPEVSWDEFN